jgi:hypothetical protein
MSDFKNPEYSRPILAKSAILEPRENQFSWRRDIPLGQAGGSTDMTKRTSAFGTSADKTKS